MIERQSFIEKAFKKTKYRLRYKIIVVPLYRERYKQPFNTAVMNAQNAIQILQAYATGLSAQSRQHKVQSQVFASWGLKKLADKYADHSKEEAEWVDKMVARIIELGGEPKVEATPEQKIYKDVVEFIKADLAVSVKEVPVLGQVTLSLAEDMTTYDIMKAYYQDEEQDMYWMQGQLDLFECIGLQNWLVQQL